MSGLPFVLRNARFGFATNSSSSHSIILAPGLTESLKQLDGPMSYGWGNFTLTSRDEKARYMATAMMRHYRDHTKLGREECIALVRRFYPKALEHISDEDLRESYIDHDSSPSFPQPRISEEGMWPFWDFLRENIVDNDDVAILGGNDNDDGHPLWNKGPVLDLYKKTTILDSGKDSRLFSFDEKTNHLTIFNPKTGTKLRLTPADVPAPTHSTFPELCDVTLTNHCDMGCEYCYMDSTPEGKHAKTQDVYDLAWALNRMGVFEAAIGGGEPTDHPDFAKILKVFHNAGVVPSFSTQSWRWLENQEIVNAVSRYCGAVALSTQKPAHVAPWIKACRDADINSHFHYVLGLNPLENLEKFLSALDGAKHPYNDGHLVLLAHKQVGRAEDNPPISYEGWGELVNDQRWRWKWTFAIDSFLVDEVETEFENIRSTLYEKSDGKFSMYYNAVEKRAAAHSFVPADQQIPVASTYRLKDAWNQILAQSGVQA
jgi:hypothetical protein